VPPKHFLDLDALDAATLREILDLAKALKREPRPLLTGRNVALIFEKPSTRTRVSFEVGVRQLGGHAVVLSSGEMQLGRGESYGDTAQVLARFVDAVMLRTDAHGKLAALAEHSRVPVINGLTDRSHPCQIMADVMTFEERKGPIRGAKVAWVGDANNVATSWIHAAERFGFDLHIACPKDLAPDPTLVDWAGPRLSITRDPVEAVAGADCVVTDTWVSMGHHDGEARIRALGSYQVNTELMARAASDAIFMHCLPAHRGQEVTDAVMDGPRSVVFDEAENRLHAQKGILAWCLS
jgi:ornithine carbamoyltransferase